MVAQHEFSKATALHRVAAHGSADLWSWFIRLNKLFWPCSYVIHEHRAWRLHCIMNCGRNFSESWNGLVIKLASEIFSFLVHLQQYIGKSVTRLNVFFYHSCRFNIIVVDLFVRAVKVYFYAHQAELIVITTGNLLLLSIVSFRTFISFQRNLRRIYFCDLSRCLAPSRQIWLSSCTWCASSYWTMYLQICFDHLAAMTLWMSCNLLSRIFFTDQMTRGT